METTSIKELVYPISEVFSEIQGEGFWAGTLMTFIRFAGCTVGKPFPKEASEKTTLPIYITQCTTYDGRTFPCDTDYRVKERLTVSALVDRLQPNIKHVCLTGGEPLMHDLEPLIIGIHEKSRDILVHLETSGTILFDKLKSKANSTWISVSPKAKVLDQMISRANEVKLLVDEEFDINKVPKSVFTKNNGSSVYLQPINGEHTVNFENAKRCRELQNQFTQWRLSLQLHKILGVR